MVYGMIFYKATKNADYKIYHTKDDKYITKIQDNECKSYYKEWSSLERAQKYIRKKMKENENMYEHEKLEKIEQIINEYNNGNDMEYKYLDRIREVLEDE